MVQITPNFGYTRIKQSYKRKHPQQNPCMSVCLCGFREKLLTIHVKTAQGIIMKFNI